jgi:hypothetical protein
MKMRPGSTWSLTVSLLLARGFPLEEFLTVLCVSIAALLSIAP